jgi:hypothetical protein
VAALVCLVGILDSTNPGAAPAYRELDRQQSELTAFGRQLHDAVGDCAVFQLPVVAFPEEPPPGRMGDYDHLLPSNAAPNALRWSYGAIRGTDRADWQLALPVDQPRVLAQDLADAGFCAVQVDRDGYAGGNDPSSALEGVLGHPVAAAAEANLTAYSLSALTADPSRADQVLRPVFASAAGSLVDTSESVPFQWTGPTTKVTLANMGLRPTPVTVSFRIRGNGEEPRTVTVRTRGSDERRLTVNADREETVTLQLTLSPGTTSVDISATGDAEWIPGTQGQAYAALRLSDLRMQAEGVNAASLQQFAAASPRSLR